MEVAVKCMCELLVSLMHFNFRTNIMSVIVPLMDHSNPDIADMCCDTVKKVSVELQYPSDNAAGMPAVDI